MFAIERIRIIKNYLQKESKVSVAKLSELLNVTEVTIRRDLEKLESEGFLQLCGDYFFRYSDLKAFFQARQSMNGYWM